MSDTQLDLFAGGPRSRATDTHTARAAADSMTPAALNRQCRAVLDVVADLGNYGATAFDVYVNTDIQQSVASRRLTDLRRNGLVRDSGTTRSGSSGRQLTIYKITDEGREALR